MENTEKGKQTKTNLSVINAIDDTQNESITKITQLQYEIKEKVQYLKKLFENFKNVFNINFELETINDNSKNEIEIKTQITTTTLDKTLYTKNSNNDDDKLEKMKIDIKNCISNLLIKFDTIDRKIKNDFLKKYNEIEENLLSTSLSSSSLSKKKIRKIDDNNDLHFQDKEEHQENEENYEKLLLTNQELLDEINEIENLMKNIKLKTITLNYRFNDMNDSNKECIDNDKEDDSNKNIDNNLCNNQSITDNKTKSNENLMSNNNENHNKESMENFKTSYSPEEFFKAVMTKNIAEFAATAAKTTTVTTTVNVTSESNSSIPLISSNANSTPISTSKINSTQSSSTTVENNRLSNVSSSKLKSSINSSLLQLNTENNQTLKYPNCLQSLGEADKYNIKNNKLTKLNDDTNELKSPQILPSTSSTRQITNAFSYSNPEEFIKAVMISNPPQTTFGFSAKNARVFENFYKNKLSGKTTPIFQEQKNTQSSLSTSTSPSPLPAFKSAIDALPKIYGNSKGNTAQIYQNNQQNFQEKTKNQKSELHSDFSSNLCRNHEVKTKINKVKEKFAKLAMKKSNFGQSTSDKNQKSQNFYGSTSSLSSLKSQKNQKEHNVQDNNSKLNTCNTEKNLSNEKIIVKTRQQINQEQNSRYTEIQTQIYKQQQQQRELTKRQSFSRSVSESGGSVISSKFDNQSIISSRSSVNNDESIVSSPVVSVLRRRKITATNDNKMQNQQQQQQNIDNKNFSKSTQSIDLMGDENTKQKIQKRRQRGRRGSGAKGEKIFENAENVMNVSNNDKITLPKLVYPHLNSETLLILDLLSLPSAEKREKYLFELAKQRKILIENSSNKNTTDIDETNIFTSYELHPNIENYYKSILLTPEYYNNKRFQVINEEERKRLKVVINKIEQNLKEKQEEKEKQLKYYEDYVNEIVHEDIKNQEQIKEFTFSLTPKRQRTTNYFKTKNFTKRLELFAMKCVKAGLGEIIEGEIRINAKNNEQAFMKHIDGERDAMFSSQLIRKCALHGDIAKAFIRKTRPQSSQSQPSTSQPQTALAVISSELQESSVKDEDKNNQEIDNNVQINKTNDKNEMSLAALLIEDDIIEGDDEIILPEKSCKGFVIDIIKEVHNRKCVGTFLSYRKGSDFITFVPRDMKLPVMRIYKENWPEAILNNDTNLNHVTDTLYAAEIIEWRNETCIGKILHPIGKCNELDSENKAILYQNNLHIDEYDEKFNKMYYGPLIITEDEIKNRKDMRNECVFTIDPLTARDLDDALSCRILSNDNLYEIGVHISDVSYFLEENTELDKLVSERTTSVYMVNEVFHMLPKSLCFKCSLLPGEDKLAYSIFWIMDINGDVKDYYIKRTIINSCTQFAYEHAQKIIDNPNQKFTENDFPSIHNNFTIDDIQERVIIMHRIAENLRKKRFDNGALKINKPKLSFELSPDNGEPINCSVYELKTANFMIEEFMLLANQYIAKFIHDKFPKISILRNHDPPLKNLMKTLKERLSKFGLDFDITSSKTIYQSLQNLINSSKYPDAMEICLAHLVSKPMTRARYFCSENAKSKQDFWHYALSIPIYTHFTSPIRRYPDIMVHRVLSAALGYTSEPVRKPNELHYITAVCNEKKYNAKVAGEDSSNLYFKHYIKSKKSVVFRAAVLDIFSNSMEVILIETGHIIRINFPRDHEKNCYKVNVNTTKLPYTAILKFDTVENLNCDENKNENNDNTNDDHNIDNVNIKNEKQPNNKIVYPPIELKLFAEILIEVHVDTINKLKGNIALPPELKKVQPETAKKNKKVKKNKENHNSTKQNNIKVTAEKEEKRVKLVDNDEDLEIKQINEEENLKMEEYKQQENIQEPDDDLKQQEEKDEKDQQEIQNQQQQED